MANTIKLKRASGSDPGNSDLATGELAIRTSNCKLFSKNDSGSAIGIVAGSADTLTTARTIAGVSFDGSGNISLNNNAITNGAGYIADIVSDTSPQLGGNLDVNGNDIISASNGDIDLRPNGTGAVVFKGVSGNGGNGAGRFKLNCENNSHGITIQGPPHSAAANYTLTLPNNDGGSNEFLKTDGSGNLSWASADGGNAATLGSIGPGQFMRDDQNQTATGLITLTTGLELGADAKCIAAVSSLSDGSSITVDFASGIHHSVTLGGNRTITNTNTSSAVGQSGSIFITQDGTGSRTASFQSYYKFPGGTAPTLSTAANAVDRLDYVIKESGVIHCVVTLDVK
tara:strand:- start:3605 stop:4630 length:1026 start_codon:yes stop_codon:yes gene_type:complete